MTDLIEKVKSSLYIAAIGASSGRLEALQKLIAHIPNDTENVAFIIVQHLSPNRKSLLAQSLSRHTVLKVVEVKKAVLVKGGTIYVSPPDHDITLKNGKLYPGKNIKTPGPHPSIDTLLSSLASDQKAHSIGIILSGKGSDGSIGIKSLKKAGGITIVQEPKSAKYNSMPLAAIETGKIDYILPTDKIGEKIKLLSSNSEEKSLIQPAGEIMDKGFSEILELLSKETETDFTNYKHNTLYRRITKRLSELHLDTTNQYLKFIKENPSEIEELNQNLLIGVSSFFRDPAIFHSLEKKIATMIDSKEDNEALRVWIPGCATGEEAYSIGIMIDSILKKKKKDIPVHIFATDINEHALSFARKGVYQQKYLHAVPSHLLKQYFIPHTGFSELSKSIRSMILFAKHDLTINPPFLKLDIIVCRNLLMYFNAKLQEYVFPVFYSALKPNGLLVLGKSESIGHFTNLFSTVSSEMKFYKRIARSSINTIQQIPFSLKQQREKNIPQQNISISDMVKETIFKLFEHPYVVVNDTMDIQEIKGDISRYLGLKQKQMNANLIKLAHKDLKLEIRLLINKCAKQNKEIKGDVRRIEKAGKEHFVRISVSSIVNSTNPENFYLIAFEDAKKEKIQKTSIPADKYDTKRVKETEVTKEVVQEFADRLEKSNVELQSLNEESRSAHEELKTVNAELQSTNEEINIAYHELKATNELNIKQDELLRKSESNVVAMLNNVIQAMILIDKNYEIITFNKAASLLFKNIFNTTISVGYNFQELLSKKELSLFSVDFNKSLTGKIITGERNFTDKKGEVHFYYFTFNTVMNEINKPECTSFSLLDITELKQVKNELGKSEKLMESVFHTADIGIAIIDSSGLFVKINDGFRKLLGYGPNELTGKPYINIIAPTDRKETATQQALFLAGNPGINERKIICKDGRIIDSYITNNLFVDNNQNKFLVKTVRDISESKKLKDLLHEVERINNVGGYDFDLPTNEIMWTEQMYSIFELDRKTKITREKLDKFYTEESREISRRVLDGAYGHGKSFNTEIDIITARGNKKRVQITGAVKKVKSKVVKLTGTVQDITHRKETEIQLQRLSLVASRTNNAVIITNELGKIQWVNESFVRMTGFDLSEVVGKNAGEVLEGPETDLTIINKISDQLLKRETVTEVLKYYRKDGNAFWINMDITPVFNEGKLINFLVVGVDITELIEAKEAQKTKETLEHKQALFSAIAKNFPDGIIGVLDNKFNYVFAGGTEIYRLGLTPELLIGEHIFDSLSEKNNIDAEPFLKKAFEGEHVFFEEGLRGSTYAINAVPLLTGNKEIDQVLVVLHNITKRKKAEEEVWQALTKQKELNELKSKFVSIASHEFRTPLSGILSSAEVLSKYNLDQNDERIQKHINRITQSVKGLTEILNDFLSLGKIEEGKIRNILSEFNVIEFCKKITDDIRHIIKTDQSLIYQHKGDAHIISLDPQLLRPILINLLTNAIKYSDEGKRIWLSFHTTNGRIQFSVKDEGIGIPVEDQPHLFQTFFRAHNTGNIYGSGMGLHIVKRYLDIMGGTIQFSSEVNKGSVFTIQFPLVSQHEEVRFQQDAHK